MVYCFHLIQYIHLKMTDPDSLQRFLFEQANVRGEIIRLEQTYQTIISQHNYPELIKQLLGEALMSAAFLASSIKFEGSIKLQFQGDQRLPLLIIQCDHRLNLRALVKYDTSKEDLDYKNAFLDGSMTIFIDQDNQTQTYQSIVPIKSISMAENLSHYFAQSEQIKTRIWFVTTKCQAVGMLLQLMPATETLENETFWNYAVTIGETITNNELLTLDNQTILHRLYHETELRLFPARHVSFRCQCSLDKMQQVIKMLNNQELQQLIKDKQKVIVTCDFCNKIYKIDPLETL